MPIVTLLTDFGLADPYAGIMKGVILSIRPDIRIIDLTHQIAPQDIQGAAYALFSAYRYFPPKTIHVVVVDPGVGTDRRIVAVENEFGIFLAPDNGALSMVLDDTRVRRVISVDRPDLYLEPVSRTFHGRDIFAPLAGHIADGLDLDTLGPAIGERELVRLDMDLTVRIYEHGIVEGRIITVDRFGNLISNIGQKDLAAAFGNKSPEHMAVEVYLGDSCIPCISRAYQSVQPGAPLALMGSSGKLEISVNAGDASAYFNAAQGAHVVVRRTEEVA